jgi:glycosyltransferase involved in cell wall biosynthesis
MKNLTLVIPAKYEKESLPFVLNEIKDLDCLVKVILQSNDTATIESTVGYDCEIIHQKNLGYGDALITGINSVETEYFCIFNADGSFDPKEIITMLNILTAHQGDFVFGSRYQRDCGSDDDTIVTYFGNFLFTKIGKIFFNLSLTDILYTFVLGRTKSFKLLNCEQKDFRFCVELPILANRAGMKILNSNNFERSRFGGKKKVNALRDGFLILKYMLFLYFYKK